MASVTHKIIPGFSKAKGPFYWEDSCISGIVASQGFIKLFLTATVLLFFIWALVLSEQTMPQIIDISLYFLIFEAIKFLTFLKMLPCIENLEHCSQAWLPATDALTIKYDIKKYCSLDIFKQCLRIWKIISENFSC